MNQRISDLTRQLHEEYDKLYQTAPLSYDHHFIQGTILELQSWIGEEQEKFFENQG